jgi:hypothetical protein
MRVFLSPHPFKGVLMFKQIIFCTLLLAASPLAVHAGQGVIRETDSAIIVEYSGENDADVKAAKTANEREENQAEGDAEKQKALAELRAEKAKAKAVIRAQKEPREREEGE